MNATLETIDGRPALHFERHLQHPFERVWRAVTEPRELACWFVAPVPWKPELGEVFAGAGQTGEITELDAPRVIAWTWGEERYRFELRPTDDGCVLVFTHVFDEALGNGAQHAAGWEAYLARLDAHLGGGALSEEQAHANAGERHEHYAARFGVDPEPGRRLLAAMAPLPVTLHDGPSLRLERRYEQPVERVWRAISDPAELEQWFPSGEPLEVSEREAPFLLAGTWFGDALRFELRPDGAGCVLVFTHAFADRETSARTAAGWDRCFARLDALLAGRPMSERASLQTWLDVHERYAGAFGVDPEIGRQAYASHPLT
ncbi:MAG: hypothetical protein QOJ35_3637 [Solirubrobacteraceae bacterium]|jgi:uncharacterized protein YndB with AHSA1/START domain|nr:hypothetical protein [Solirubrobacteraceae bacterium]